MNHRRRIFSVSWLAPIASGGFACGVASYSLAAQHCPDIARAAAELRPGDRFQETSLLFTAAKFGCEPEARGLLDRGAAIDARDRTGSTALAKAAEAGKVEVVTLLLEHGAHINARAIDGSTPLFLAAQADRGNAVALLLAKGADPNPPGRKGLTPLEAAAYNNAETSVRLLLQHGANPDALDDEGKSAIVYAAGRANTAVVGALLDAGVDINRRYAHGLTALMWAAGPDVSAGTEDVEATVRLLLTRGARADLKDDRGQTAAAIAQSSGRESDHENSDPLDEADPSIQSPARYAAIAFSCSGVTEFMRSDMPGLLARVCERKSIMVLKR